MATTTTTSTTSTTGRASLLGPLTTVFTQPRSCSTFVLNVNSTGPVSQFRAAVSCTSNAQFGYESDCYPPVTSPTPGVGPGAGFGFYSPGLYCPSNFVTACGAINPGSGSSLQPVSGFPYYNFQQPLIAGETAYGCCPQGFTCTATTSSSSRVQHLCILTSTGVSVNAVFCSNTGSVNTTVTASSATLLINMVQLYLQSNVDSKLTLPPADPTTSNPAITTNSQTTPTTIDPIISPSSQPLTGPNHGSGTPMSTILGVGIGVGVGGIILLVALVLLIVRRRRIKNLARAHWQSSPGVAVVYEPGVAMDDVEPIPAKQG